MAAFTRQRAPAAWTTGSVVTASEFEGIDAIRPSLMNMTGGSSHAPSTQCVIGGSGLSITGPCALANLTSCVVQSGGTLTTNVGSTVNLNGTSNFKNLRSASGGAALLLDTDCVATIQSNAFVSVSGTAHIDLNTGTKLDAKTGSTVEISSGATLDCQSGSTVTIVDATFSGDVTFSGSTGALNTQRLLTLVGTGSGIVHRVANAADSSITLGVTVDEYRIPRTLAANRVYTLRSSTTPIPVTGQRLRVSRTVGLTSKATFQREDGTVLGELIVSAFFGFLEFTYNVSTGWYVSAASGTSTVSDPGGTY